MKLKYSQLTELIKTGLVVSLVITATILISQGGPNVAQTIPQLAADAQTETLKDKTIPTRPDQFPNIRIKNFGQMDKRFFRGAQPQKDDYQSLVQLGVRTVIDLRDDPTDYEKAAVEALGMKYINIPMSDRQYPKLASIEEFLKLANDSRTGIFFVHCEGGRHRTGVTGAVYRLTKYGWNFEQVYQEMKNYDFYTRWGHGAMKDFVIDYAAKMKIRPGGN